MEKMPQSEFELFEIEDFNSFGKRLEALRKSRNLSQNYLSLYSGISRNSISAYENNKRKARPVVVSQLAKALDIDPKILSDSKEFYKHSPSLLKNYNPDTGQFFLARET